MKSHPVRLVILLALVLWTARSLSAANFTAGASPTASNTVRLEWNSAGTGLVYSVQSRDRLRGGLWLPAPNPQPWPVATNAWTESRASAAQFYRVVALPAAQRGKLLSAPLTRTMSTFEINLLFSVAGIPLTAQYPVRLHKLTYETIDAQGGRTTATAALALPQGTGRRLRLMSYQHGTISRTNDAPSSMSISNELAVGIAMATTGYAALLPDYLGLGNTTVTQSYHHARSEASACVDALRAVYTLCATNGYPLTNRLFLLGYSHGGHVTMALAREIETYHAAEFPLTAVAPMAGAYDMSGTTLSDFLSDRLQPNPYYFAMLLAAYQDVYHVAPSLADMLRSPYNTTLPPLLRGNASGSQINAAMPADAKQVLKPEYLAAFTADPWHPLRVALADNDVYAWRPIAPMRLYHCSGDQDVLYANSEVALQSFHQRGATQVQLLNPDPGGDHGDCVQPSLLGAKAWFDSFP